MAEIITKKNTCSHFSSSKSLAIHKDSHTTSKLPNKPKIRIIHIFAPEIIKTDVANFRELVQRLTGKQSNEKLVRKYKSEEPINKKNILFSEKKKIDINKAGFGAKLEAREKVKEEEVKEEEEEEEEEGGMWFTDLEGLIHELGCDQFPFLSNFDTNSHMQFGYDQGTQL